MHTLIRFNKPFKVLSQFTDQSDRKTLADYLTVKNVYPAGRLDFDSEGLLLLTDNGTLQSRITQPRFKIQKTYWVQVEGRAEMRHIEALTMGIMLNDGPARALSGKLISEPSVWLRNPPIRQRKTVNDSWIELVINEGRNRQVRRMTASVGLPTLRLIRVRIGRWHLDGLNPGEHRTENVDTHDQLR